MPETEVLLAFLDLNSVIAAQNTSVPEKGFLDQIISIFTS